MTNREESYAGPLRMVTKSIYITTDDREFRTKAAAVRHQRELAMAELFANCDMCVSASGTANADAHEQAAKIVVEQFKTIALIMNAFSENGE